MTRSGQDQAAGLRQLLARSAVRVVPVTAGAAGIGKTMFVINFAAALDRQGNNVVVLDQSAGEIPSALGMRYRYELEHLLTGEKEFEEVALRGPGRVHVLPAMRGMRALAEAGEDGDDLFGAFTLLSNPPDMILMNAPAHEAETACAVTGTHAAGREVVLMVSDSSASVTATYTQMKQLAQEQGQRHFRLLVNRAPSEKVARRLWSSMVAAAKCSLPYVELAYGGFIPRDPNLREARQALDTVFSTAPSADSARAFTRLAAMAGDWMVPEFAFARPRPADFL